LISSIRDDNPVLFFENEVLYAIEGDVLEERLTTFCAVPILSLLSRLVA
jgi:pyruvate/2-oxoglutarate/acetoin dehydrogenase E1 component